MSVSYFLVPHQSINRLAILDKSAMNSLVLLTTCVRCTVNHYADVVLFIDFTRQFLSHHFAYHGNKVIATFIVCVCRPYRKSILLLEGKNCLIFRERQFFFGNSFLVFSSAAFPPLCSPCAIGEFWTGFCFASKASRARRWPPPMLCFCKVSFLNVRHPTRNSVLPAKWRKSATRFTSHFVFILMVNYPVELFPPLT